MSNERMSRMHTMNSDHELYNSSTSLDSRFSIVESIMACDRDGRI